MQKIPSMVLFALSCNTIRLHKYIYMTYLGMFQSVHSLFQFCSIGVDLQAVDDTVLGELIAYYNVLVLDRITVSASVYCLIL